jgi:hypothetical protein
LSIDVEPESNRCGRIVVVFSMRIRLKTPGMGFCEQLSFLLSERLAIPVLDSRGRAIGRRQLW